MITMGTLVLIGASLVRGLPSLHIAMELISNFGAKNTGDYLRANVMNEAILPGILLLKEHMKRMEETNSHQDVWLVALTSVCSIIFGMGLVVILVRKSLKGKHSVRLDPTMKV